MTSLAIVQAYFDAWNRKDTDAVLATFTEDGTYEDPISGAGIKGEALAAYMQGLWTAFPDLSFEIVSMAEAGAGIVAAQWMMRGTNTGVMKGLPPTGKSVALEGADFIKVENGRIQHLKGYFDPTAVSRQLGRQVIIQPTTAGPFVFGTSKAVQSGKNVKPGCFSITMLQARSDDEVQQIGDLSRQTVLDIMKMEGFIGWTGVTLGHRMLTITAWEHAENPRQLAQSPTHQEAMRKYFGQDLADGGWVSAWVPDRIGPMYLRCPACARMVDPEKLHGVCTCQAPLPPNMAYW